MNGPVSDGEVSLEAAKVQFSPLDTEEIAMLLYFLVKGYLQCSYGAYLTV